MKTLVAYLLALPLLAVSLAVPARAELMKNGSFDQGAEDWGSVDIEGHYGDGHKPLHLTDRVSHVPGENAPPARGTPAVRPGGRSASGALKVDLVPNTRSDNCPRWAFGAYGALRKMVKADKEKPAELEVTFAARSLGEPFWLYVGRTWGGAVASEVVRVGKEWKTFTVVVTVHYDTPGVMFTPIVEKGSDKPLQAVFLLDDVVVVERSDKRGGRIPLPTPVKPSWER